MTQPPIDLTRRAFAVDDQLNRKSTADTLLNIVRYAPNYRTLFLDSPWGTGKTVFVTRFIDQLRAHGIPSIYFDAFRHDITNDPFSSICGTIHTALREQLPVKHPVVGKIARAGGVVAKSLLSVGAKVAVNAATAGLLSGGDISKALKLDKVTADSIAKTIDEFGDKAVEKALANKIASHTSMLAAISNLKEALRETAEQLSKVLAKEDGVTNDNKQNRLVFIIDELDRCKPDFALQVMEIVKHLINEDHITFLFSVDTKQLQNSVRHVYGQHIDANRYLEKFYDLRVTFSEPNYAPKPSAASYLDYLRRALPTDHENGMWTEHVIASVEPFIDHFDFSFRTVEKIYNRVHLALIQTTARSLRPGILIAALVVLEKVAPDVLRQLIDGRVGRQEVEHALELNHWRSKYASRAGRLRAWLDLCTVPQDSPLSPEATALAGSLNNYSVERTRVIQVICNNYLFAFNLPK